MSFYHLRKHSRDTLENTDFMAVVGEYVLHGILYNYTSVLFIRTLITPRFLG